MVKKILLLALTAFITMLCGCTKGSGVEKNADERNTDTVMSMSYDEFTGYRETQIEVKENETVTVTVNIVTDSGDIDVYIARDNNTDNCAYEGNNIPTLSFKVTLPEPGNYTVRVDAEKHVGGYYFSWGE